MVELCNIDGTIHPEAEAVIPVMDRGFLFGDSVYEVIRTRRGQPFAWREHLDRLAESARAIALPLDIDDRTLLTRIRDTLEASGSSETADRYIRIIVSRGTGTAPNIDLGHAPGPSRWVIMVRGLPGQPSTPARVALVERERVGRRALDPAIKSGNYLNNVLGLAEAKALGATDCLFLNAQGELTEASTSNVYLVSDNGEIQTPPLSAGILAGITRNLIQICAKAHGIQVLEQTITETQLQAASEIFLSSTLRDIAPVTDLNGRQLLDSESAAHGGGPVTAKLSRQFTEFCDRRAVDHDGPAFDAVIAGSG